MQSILTALGIDLPDASTLASFLLPQVSRRFVARVAEQGPQAEDLPILLQFAPSHPDPDIHRMILASLTKVMETHQLRRFFAVLYELGGPGRDRRRQLIREVLASFDASCLAPLWERSSLEEKLDLLDRLESPRAHAHMPVLIRRLGLLHLKHPSLRARVTSLLGKLPSKSRRRFLESRLEDSDTRVRANAVEALAPLLQADEAWRVLSPLTRDPAPRVQANAILGLIRLGSRPAQDALAELLSSDKITIKASARWVLKQLPKTGQQPAVRFSSAIPRPLATGPTVRFWQAPTGDSSVTDRLPEVGADGTSAERA